MLRLRKFEPSDIEKLHPDVIDTELLTSVEYCREWAEYNVLHGPAYTALIRDRIVGAAGIRLHEQNTGILWAVFTTAMRQHVKSMLRSSRALIAILLEEFEITTLYAESRKGFAASQRLLEHLGFKRTTDETSTHYFYKLEV